MSRGGFSRSELLRGGAVLALSGGGLAALAAPADAVTVPDNDLAYLRLLGAAELLKADFQAQALAADKLNGAGAALVRQMQADDKAHYASLSILTNGAGQPPPTAGDIDFTYPAGTFAKQGSIVKLAHQLAGLTLGAYLGAIENVQTSSLRLPIGQIAANEAQQMSALARLLGRAQIGHAFAPSLSIDAVSAQLDRFES
jgi:ferritin-like protein